MSSDPREAIRKRLLDQAFKPGEGVDQNGRPLAWSLDCRELILHGPTLDTIADLLWPRVAAHRPGLIAGPSLSADPIVAALLLAAGRRGVELSGGLLRREPKGYGLQKLIEGPPIVPGVTAVVVDDVLNSGSSAGRTVRTLRELGAIPRAVVTIVELSRACRLEGIVYNSLFTAGELGLERPAAPLLSTKLGWTVRGVNAPIPPARPIPPLFARDEVILAGDRRGVLAVDRLGRVRELNASGVLCMEAVDNLLVLGNARATRAVGPSLRPLWTIDVGARAVCYSSVGDVFIACNDAPEVLRIDAHTGTIIARSTLVSCAEFSRSWETR